MKKEYEVSLITISKIREAFDVYVEAESEEEAIAIASTSYDQFKNGSVLDIELEEIMSAEIITEIDINEE